VERFFFTWVTVIAALSAAAGPGVARADDERPVSESLLPVSARADIAVRGESGGLAVLLLTDRVELGRGDSRMQADRAILWIDPTRSHQLGKVLMEVYAEGNVRTVEQGVRVTSPRVFFRWTASKLTVDDTDGLIPTQSGPFKGPFMERAEAARKAGVVPREPATVLPPKEKPPVAQFPPRETPGIAEVPPREPKPPSGKVPPKEVPPSGVVEPARIGLIYGQQQEGPDIKTTVEGDYRVTVITRYPDIVFQDPTSERGQFEILAENMVIWVNESKLKEPGGLREADLQIYAEGHVVIYEERKTIQCEQLFYDYKDQRGLMAGGPGGLALVRATTEDRTMPFYYRAKEFRQVSADRYTSRNVTMSTSEFNPPEWGIVCSEVALTAGTRTVTDESGRTREVQAMERADAWDTKLEVEGVPLFYWPYFSHDLQNNRTILRKAHLVSSNQYGFGAQTEWDLYDLGVYQNDWSDLRFLYDYYSKRGTGLGLKFDYTRPDYWGNLMVYTIHDTGIDRTGLPPDDPQRIRVDWQHRQTLSEHWRLDAELSYLSDSQFLDEYWEKIAREEKERETYANLRYLNENKELSILARYRLNDFQTQTEYLPEARFAWTGEPILGDRLTYIQDTHLGYVRRLWDDKLQDVGLLPANYQSLRLISEHEVQYPMDVGIFRVVPFVDAAFSAYNQVISGQADRVALTAGTRASTSFWHIYDVNNRLWDINRLRHVVTPSVAVFDTVYLSKQPDAIYQFDEFDSAGDQKVVQFELRQRLQTRRLFRSTDPEKVGGWYTVDWMALNLELNYFPSPDRYDNGHTLSPMRAEYRWQVSDRLALLSDADIRVDSTPEIETFDLGLSWDRSPKLNLYIGQRYIRESGSNITIGQLDYKLDERWNLGFFAQYDFGLGASNDYRVVFKRRLHRWILEFGYEYNATQHNHEMTLMLWPQGVAEGQLRFF
jgi:hypothetical protein